MQLVGYIIRYPSIIYNISIFTEAKHSIDAINIPITFRLKGLVLLFIRNNISFCMRTCAAYQ